MSRQPILLAFLALSTTAFGGQLPDHIVWNIQLTVRTADVVAVVTVDSVSDAPRPGTVVLALARAVVGELPQQVEIPADGFDPRDLVAGTQLLVALRQRPGDLGWTSTGRYELVTEGKVREYDQELYLSKTAEVAQEALAVRARRAAQPSNQALREVRPSRRNTKLVARSLPCQNFTPSEGCTNAEALSAR